MFIYNVIYFIIDNIYFIFYIYNYCKISTIVPLSNKDHEYYGPIYQYLYNIRYNKNEEEKQKIDEKILELIKVVNSEDFEFYKPIYNLLICKREESDDANRKHQFDKYFEEFIAEQQKVIQEKKMQKKEKL